MTMSRANSNTDERKTGETYFFTGCFMFVLSLFPCLLVWSCTCGISVYCLPLPVTLLFLFSIVFASLIPGAIGQLVKRYAGQEDLKTVASLRKDFIILQGFHAFLILVLTLLLSGPLSRFILSGHPDEQVFLRNLFILSGLSGSVQCFLAVYRGFYLAVKSSRFTRRFHFLEQGMSFVFWVLSTVTAALVKADPMISVLLRFIGVLLSSCVILGMYVKYDRGHVGVMLREARASSGQPVRHTKIYESFMRMILFPMICLLLFSLLEISGQSLLLRLCGKLAMDGEKAEIICAWTGVYTMVLFLPVYLLSFHLLDRFHLLHPEDVSDRTRVQTGLEMISFISFPAAMVLFAFSSGFVNVIWGGENLEYACTVLQWQCLQTAFFPLACYGLYVSCVNNRRKGLIFDLLVALTIRGVLLYVLTLRQGYTGAVLSGIVAYASFVYMVFAGIHHDMNISSVDTAVHLFRIILSVLCMNGAFAILGILGISADGRQGVEAAGLLLGNLCVGTLVYLYISSILRLPQNLFGTFRIKIPWQKRSEENKDDAH